jgi:hypothetical protein
VQVQLKEVVEEERSESLEGSMVEAVEYYWAVEAVMVGACSVLKEEELMAVEATV